MLKAKSYKFNSVLISADSQAELGQTFMRFQEHYESPNLEFRNKIFTRGQYLHWYSKEYGAATYHIDWTGFNIPSYILTPFKNGLFDPLTDQEQELLDILKYRTERFYIIGANDDSIIRHELSHALYYHSDKYYKAIHKVFDENKGKIKKISKYILDMGYTEGVLYDELQAYITDNDDEFILENCPKKLIQKINRIYEKYALDSGTEV
jgi:hypothetical protein